MHFPHLISHYQQSCNLINFDCKEAIFWGVFLFVFFTVFVFFCNFVKCICCNLTESVWKLSDIYRWFTGFLFIYFYFYSAWFVLLKTP